MPKDRNYIKSLMTLYAVTDRSGMTNDRFFEVLHDTLLAGATLVQLREKTLEKRDFIELARDVNKMCSEFSVPLIINDDVEVAKAVGASGVHIGQSDTSLLSARGILGDDAIIGVSAHNVKEAVDAQKSGADYLGLGAVFATNTKNDVDIMDFDTLFGITEAVEIPTCAIGGINKETILKLKGSGIDGVAVVSAIFSSQNPLESTRTLLKMSKELFGK